MVLSFDQGFDAKLRPAWLRPAALAIVVAAHALLLLAVLWPKEALAPAETKIEISIVPQRLAAEPAIATSAVASPQLPPSEAAPVDIRSPVDAMAPSDEIEPVETKPAEPALPLEIAPALAEIRPAEPARPLEIAPQPAEIGLAAPVPTVAPELPQPVASASAPQPVVPQAPPVVRAVEGTIPVPPTQLAPPVAKAKDDEAQRLAAERRRQLQRENEAAEREAIRREAVKRQAAEKERQAAEDAKRQAAETAKRQAEARQRAAQNAAAASRLASLPPVQTPVATGGPARSAASPAAIGAYGGQVKSHLNAYKHYPESARSRGAQGRPSVSFSLDASGRVTSVSLSHSSGQADLDAEAVAMVRRASPFPAPPPGANRTFNAGIDFGLH
ncbi:MAG: energy transducer TonB [Hyphomicrobiales bacterium]